MVTARALAPLDRLLGWAMPLVAPHGVLLAMKGSSAAEEIEAAAEPLRELRLRGAGDPRADGTGRIVHSHRGPGGPRGSGAAKVTPWTRREGMFA